MIALKRGVALTINHGAGNCLRWGPANGVSLSENTVVLWVTLGGGIDRGSGFVVNIFDIDEALREALAAQEVTVETGWEVLAWGRKVLCRKFLEQKVLELRLAVHENLSFSQVLEEREMIQVTKRYELAAAHRLFNPDWDEARNREVFGKCNNAEGHGHNYLVELTLGGDPDPESGTFVDMKAVDEIVEAVLLDRFDHKFLNRETEEFSRLNPTVENMAKVFWELLIGRFEGAETMKVGVWETDRTYAEYAGPAVGDLRYGENV